jgi:hypothetical protein
MLAAIEEWRPHVVVRESAEFSALIAVERLGARHARVGIGLSTELDELGATVGVAPGHDGQAADSLCLTMAPASLDGPRSAESEGAATTIDDGLASLPRLEQAVLELLSVARYRDRARAIADEIQDCRRSTKQPTRSRHCHRHALSVRSLSRRVPRADEFLAAVRSTGMTRS